MPVQVTERALRDAVAVLGEHDPDAGRVARSALEWLGWQGDGPLLVRRYDVQLFVWYTLPRKFLASLEHKREAAAALAQALEQLGGRAASYADVCRSADTDALLCAWEDDEPAAWLRLRALLDASGLEPPDSELLAWGETMGLQEARAREAVATTLEVAIEDGRLAPGARGFGRRQRQVAVAALREPADTGDGRSLLEVVHAERLDGWLARGRIRGSAQRTAIIQPVVAAVSTAAAPIDPDVASAAVAPARWLLDRARDGIALTQTGALNRALVRDIVNRWPDWWDSRLFGPPNREHDVAMLHELHALLRRARLVRRQARQIVLTSRGRALADDPGVLLSALAVELLAGDSFTAACGELAAALILHGATIDYSDDLATQILPAIAAEGWQHAGEHPCVRDAGWGIANVLRPAESIGVLAQQPGVTRRTRDHLMLTDAGRAALTIALRARALAPAKRPY